MALEMLDGGYRTRTFGDVFPDFETFEDKIAEAMTVPYLDEEHHPLAPTPEVIYVMLAAEYKNSHVASSDEGRFVLKCAALLYQYAPQFQKEMETQAKLRAMTDDELLSGAEMIANDAAHPASHIDVDDHEKIDTVNGQRTSWEKKDITRGYAELFALLDAELPSRFVERFRRLFLVSVAPLAPLLYPEIED